MIGFFVRIGMAAPLSDGAVTGCWAGVRCWGSIVMKSLLKTSLNSVHRNFDMILLNSKENGGPLRSLMRDETSVPTKLELKKDA